MISKKEKEAGHYSGIFETKRFIFTVAALATNNNTDAAPQTYASLHTRNSAFLHLIIDDMIIVCVPFEPPPVPSTGYTAQRGYVLRKRISENPTKSI